MLGGALGASIVIFIFIFIFLDFIFCLGGWHRAGVIAGPWVGLSTLSWALAGALKAPAARSAPRAAPFNMVVFVILLPPWLHRLLA